MPRGLLRRTPVDPDGRTTAGHIHIAGTHAPWSSAAPGSGGSSRRSGGGSGGAAASAEGEGWGADDALLTIEGALAPPSARPAGTR